VLQKHIPPMLLASGISLSDRLDIPSEISTIENEVSQSSIRREIQYMTHIYSSDTERDYWIWLQDKTTSIRETGFVDFLLDIDVQGLNAVLTERDV
jgi:hypothetical protein